MTGRKTHRCQLEKHRWMAESNPRPRCDGPGDVSKPGRPCHSSDLERAGGGERARSQDGVLHLDTEDVVYMLHSHACTLQGNPPGGEGAGQGRGGAGRRRRRGGRHIRNGLEKFDACLALGAAENISKLLFFHISGPKKGECKIISALAKRHSWASASATTVASADATATVEKLPFKSWARDHHQFFYVSRIKQSSDQKELVR